MKLDKSLNRIETCFLKTLNDFHPRWEEKKYLIAFSAGADSTALALLGAKYLKNCLLGHLNHNLRGDLALRDQEFCQKLATNLNLKIIIGQEDVKKLAKIRGRGLEEAGRFARYQFLEKSVKANHFDYILTAHHADDSVETLLINILRGSGLNGLRSIPSKNNLFWRPLIKVRRHEIESWLKLNKQIWMSDHTNQDPCFLRNRIRNELVPLLENIVPKSSEKLLSLISEASLEDEFWQNHLKKLSENILREEKEAVCLDNVILKKLSETEIKKLIKKASWKIQEKLSLSGTPSRLTIEKARKISLGEIKARDLPGGIRVSLKNDLLYFEGCSRFKEKNKINFYDYNLSKLFNLNDNFKENRFLIPKTNYCFLLKKINSMEAEQIFNKKNNNQILVKAPWDKLRIRSFRFGDKISFNEGQQKISDIFNQKQIILNERLNWPVLLNGKKILWLVGLKRCFFEFKKEHDYLLIEVKK